ncbi:MAG: AraC family transcriptional regulator [Leptospira sp.]|nr:AraC family transcriptional regulator [Leptospira sp.]
MSWLKSKIHYLPFILASFYMIYEMIQISDVRLDRILYLQDRLNHQIESDIIFQVEPIVKFLSIAGSLHLSFYVLQPGFELVRYFRLEILQRVPSIRFLSILLATIACANLGALLLGFFESQFGLEMGLFFLSCIPPLIYLIHSVYPTLFDELRDAIQEEKRYKNSQLKNINLDDLHLKIQSLLKGEKIYLEEGVKLNIVADKLQITSHQLSEYINTQTGKTYQNWLNGYRIDHACFLLKEKPEWAIIRIAYESGFSSKSSFQDAFKKEMGITPSEYRKSR